MKNQLKSGVLISYATMLISNIIPMVNISSVKGEKVNERSTESVLY